MTHRSVCVTSLLLEDNKKSLNHIIWMDYRSKQRSQHLPWSEILCFCIFTSQLKRLTLPKGSWERERKKRSSSWRTKGRARDPPSAACCFHCRSRSSAAECSRAGAQFVIGVLSPEKLGNGGSWEAAMKEGESRGGRQRRRRICMRGSNFAALAFSDRRLTTVCSPRYKSNGVLTAQEREVVADARHVATPVASTSSGAGFLCHAHGYYHRGNVFIKSILPVFVSWQVNLNHKRALDKLILINQLSQLSSIMLIHIMSGGRVLMAGFELKTEWRNVC